MALRMAASRVAIGRLRLMASSSYAASYAVRPCDKARWPMSAIDTGSRSTRSRSAEAAIMSFRRLAASMRLRPCALISRLPISSNQSAGTQTSRSAVAALRRPDHQPTGGQVQRAIHGQAFDAEQYDRERTERYGRRIGFY